VEESQKLWREEKPDEYFFLEIFGSAVVEHLVTTTGARLCAWAEQHDMAVLPHYSPGYGDWDVAEQRRLLELMSPPFPLGVFESACCVPRNPCSPCSALRGTPSVFKRLSGLVPCQTCSFGPCSTGAGRSAPRPSPIDQREGPATLVAERLSLERRDGLIHARFRYEGTTCTNMGRALVFDYGVVMGPRELGYPILEQQCSRAGDTGHTCMCKYAEAMPEIAREKPLAGQFH